MDALQPGPVDALGYRRPPATASFEDLRRRGQPEVLFVHSFLPEGVIICDVDMFAAMIEEAYNPPQTLLVNPPDENGNQLCRGLIGNGLWEWAVVHPGWRWGRSGWRMTLAPERDGQRQATVEGVAKGHDRDVTAPTVATFSISTRPVGQPSAGNPVLVDAIGGLKYRRPPATVSFDGLGERGLPRVLFVGYLPEGITACDVNVFAAMIEEAYRTPGALHMHPDLDEHGNEQCTGMGSAGTWEWQVARPSKPDHFGDRYQSAWQVIHRILLAPEQDGTRACTVLLGYAGHPPEDDRPVTFTIRTRPGPASPARGEAVADPAGAAVGLVLSGLADQAPAAAGLLRLLSFLAPEPLPLGLLLAGERAAGLPVPEAATAIGPLLGDPVAAGDAVHVLRRSALLRPADGGVRQRRPGRRPFKQLSPADGVGEVVPPLVRDAARGQLTAQESAQWRQVAAAVVEAAVPDDDPQAPASWPCAMLLPHARAVLDPTSDGMARIARRLGESGSYQAARDLCRLIADAHAAGDAYGPDHPRTLAARRELAHWTEKAAG